MDLLNDNMRTTVTKKLLFTLNFMMMMSEDLFEVFNVIITDVENNNAKRFDLVSKDTGNVCISFKAMTNGDYGMCYQHISETDGTMTGFEVYINEKDSYYEYYDAVTHLFKLVTAKGRYDQYNNMTDAINNLLRK